MDTKAYRATRGIWTITTVLLVAACGPTDDNSITGIDDTDTADTTPPTVASMSPSNGQSSVAVGSSIRVSFSEAMSSASFNASSFILSDGMAGSVSSSGQSAVFAPSGDLEYATTYTATVRGTVTDAAGNALGSDHSWSFTTEAAPAPPFSMALSAGRGWVYEVSWTRTTVGSSIGVRTTGFDGTAIVVAAGEEQIGGRAAWRLLRYDIASSGSEPLSRDVLHLSEDAEGLSTWVTTSSGGGWRRVLSTQAASFTNNHFLMAGDPRGPTTTMSVSQVTVPAGSYTTLRAHVEHTVTGQYVPEDIFETRTEHYADGVGLVRASWDFDFDDNDPSAFDVFEQGTIELVGAQLQSGFWAVDAEPNDGPSAAAAQPLDIPGLREGAVATSDPGTLVSDPNVHANVNGQPVLQDWYRFTLASTRDVRVDLAYEEYGNGAWNDVDLYLFSEGPGGTPIFVAKSTGPQGEAEWMQGQLPAGTYYLAVQGWSTPTGPVGYSLLVR